MKIAVVWDWGRASEVRPLIWDGLLAAMDIIGVDWYMDGEYPNDKYDWILPWGVGSIPFNNLIDKYHARKALLCAGHPQDTSNFEKFEVIFVESPEMRRQLSGKHDNVILAFGTDTDFYKPKKKKKIIDCFYPATYSPWKRQNLFTAAAGRNGISCGIVQPDGIRLYEECDKYSRALAGLMPSVLVADMYNVAKCCLITSWHGSERTLLEAMSSNCPVVLTRDNVLTASLANDEVILVDPNIEAIRAGVEQAINKQVNTREYVLKHYSHKIYAEKIKKVLYNN